MVELRELNVENLEEIVEENLTEDQSEYIDSNIHGLADACCVMDNDNSLYRGYSIVYNDKEIGYIMIVYQPKDKDKPEDFDNSFYMSRIVMEKRYRSREVLVQADNILTNLIKQEVARSAVTT